MKKATIIIATLVLIGVVICFLMPALPKSLTKRVNALSAPPQKETPVGLPQRSSAPIAKPDPRWAAMNAKEKLDSQWEWKTSINFFGKVVDNDNQPVINAKITFQWSDLSQEGASERVIYSNDEGLFELTGIKGKGLTVRVAKDGYTSKKARDFEYADFSARDYIIADKSNPVIFKLIEENQNSSEIVGRAEVTTRMGSSPIRIDLLNNGHVSDKGQLEISVTPSLEKYPPRYFDWEASVSIASGGLIKRVSGAPTSDAEYRQMDVLTFRANDTKSWKRVVKQAYNIKFGSPVCYGWIEIQLNGTNRHVIVDYHLDRSGTSSP